MLFSSINSMSDIFNGYIVAPPGTTKGGKKSKSPSNKSKKITVDELIFILIKKFKKDFNRKMKKGGDADDANQAATADVATRVIPDMGDLSFNKTLDLDQMNTFERETF
jgi:hypothetical protein